METFPALLAICAGNSPVTGEYPAQRPVTRSFDVLFDLRLNEQFSKQSWGWWFVTPSRRLWRHSNDYLNQWWLSSLMPFDGIRLQSVEKHFITLLHNAFGINPLILDWVLTNRICLYSIFTLKNNFGNCVTTEFALRTISLLGNSTLELNLWCLVDWGHLLYLLSVIKVSVTGSIRVNFYGPELQKRQITCGVGTT